MSKFFFVIGCVLIILLVVFLTISYVPPFYSKLQREIINNTAQTVLYFKPNSIYVPCDDTGITTTLYLNSFQNRISAAQIELQFDPDIIHNVSVLPVTDNFFGTDYTVLLDEVREQYGRATLAIQGNLGKPAKTGNGAVATISFQAVSNEASKTAIISFLNKSTVTNNSYEGSLLKSTQPLTIICAH